MREAPTPSAGRVIFVVCVDTQRLTDWVNALAHTLIARNDYRHVLDTRLEGQHWRAPKLLRRAAPEGLIRRIPATSCGLTSAYCADIAVSAERGHALYIFHAPFFRLSGALRWAWMETLTERATDCIISVEEIPHRALLTAFSWHDVRQIDGVGDDLPSVEQARGRRGQRRASGRCTCGTPCSRRAKKADGASARVPAHDYHHRTQALTQSLTMAGGKRKRSSSKDSGRVNRQRATRDPDAPKLPMSAYMLFTQKKRAEVTKAHPKLAGKKVVSKIGEMWRKASESEKKPFVAKAERATPRRPPSTLQSVADAKAPPKRPMSAYMKFAKERGAVLRSKNPSWKIGEMSKKLGAEWAALTPPRRTSTSCWPTRTANATRWRRSPTSASSARSPSKSAMRPRRRASSATTIKYTLVNESSSAIVGTFSPHRAADACAPDRLDLATREGDGPGILLRIVSLADAFYTICF